VEVASRWTGPRRRYAGTGNLRWVGHPAVGSRRRAIRLWSKSYARFMLRAAFVSQFLVVGECSLFGP